MVKVHPSCWLWREWQAWVVGGVTVGEWVTFVLRPLEGPRIDSAGRGYTTLAGRSRSWIVGRSGASGRHLELRVVDGYVGGSWMNAGW
ncbi:MAG: hypothetical protein QW328_06940 [Nitrososphaerota archaeon]